MFNQTICNLTALAGTLELNSNKTGSGSDFMS